MSSTPSFIITGASRGYGACIAEVLASEYTGARFALVARSKEALESVASELSGVASVESFAMDLSANSSELFDAWTAMLDTLNTNGFWQECSQAILVHNAGSLGPTKKLDEFTREDLADMTAYMNLNVVANMVGTSLTQQAVAAAGVGEFTQVNISSLLAVQPFAGHATYCTGKAARDMLSQVVGAEANVDDDGQEGPNNLRVRTLNWSPGPMETDMQVKLRAGGVHQQSFQDLKDKGGLVDLEVSARAMVKVLQADEYESGAHVDVYDVLDVSRDNGPQEDGAE